jgi:hypothetical protein
MADRLIEIGIVVGAIVCFVYFRIYANVWFWIGLVLLIIAMQFELVSHFLIQTLAVIFGAIYLPANMFLMFLIKKITPYKKHDMVIYSIFRVLFFPLQVIVTIFSIPYEWVLGLAH